jgi:hypothetical protein
MSDNEFFEIIKPLLDGTLKAYNDDQNRFDITIKTEANPKTLIYLKSLLAKHKFSGNSTKHGKIADIKLITIKVFDRTLPENSDAVKTLEIKWGDVETSLDISKLDKFLDEEADRINTDRNIRGAIASKEEIRLKGGDSSETTVDLTLPSELGKHSKADLQLFKWFAKDNSGNRYLRCKNGDLILIPMADGAAKEVRIEPEFWSAFWKSYRNEINEMCKVVRSKLWALYNEESSEASASGLREAPVVDAEGNFSAKQIIHEEIPKYIMGRLGARYSFQVFHHQTESVSVLKDISPVVRTSSSSAFRIPSEENWEYALSTVIPLIDDSELETISQYRDDSYGLALHRLQKAIWDKNLPEKVSEVSKLPPMWSKFFATRLGDQKFSSLYRLAKWIVGVVDAENRSRKILVLSGHGKDGKSLFLRALKHGFNKLGGRNFAVELPSDCVTEENNTQNGLLECMDARVLISSDVDKVTEYITSKTIKNITGNDTVTAQVKYRSAVKKDMTGTKIAVCTNSVTYLSDTWVSSRVSPVCFHLVRGPGEADWDEYEVTKQLVEEFSDFIGWCFQFAHAVECERGIPHNGDQPIWSDGVDPDDVRETWAVIGRFGSEDGMFRYRMSDANSDILQEDILCKIDDLFFVNKDDSIPVGKVREILSNAIGIKFRDAGADKRWNLVKRLIKEHFNLEDGDFKVSHGIRKIFGIGIKDSPMDQRSSRRSSVAAMSTQLPYGLNNRT